MGICKHQHTCSIHLFLVRMPMSDLHHPAIWKFFRNLNCNSLFDLYIILSLLIGMIYLYGSVIMWESCFLCADLLLRRLKSNWVGAGSISDIPFVVYIFLIGCLQKISCQLETKYESSAVGNLSRRSQALCSIPIQIQNVIYI